MVLLLEWTLLTAEAQVCILGYVIKCGSSWL